MAWGAMSLLPLLLLLCVDVLHQVTALNAQHAEHGGQ